MKLTVDFDYEFMDQIVEAVLLEAYKDLGEDIKSESWGKEDIEHFKHVFIGLDIVGPWFVHNWDKKKKAKK